MNDNTDYAEELINDEIKKLESYKHGLERMKTKAEEGKLEPSDACSEELLRIDADTEIKKLDSNIKSLELALDACDSVNCPVWCRDDLVNDVKVRVMSFCGPGPKTRRLTKAYCDDISRILDIIPECHRVFASDLRERYDIYVGIGAFNSYSEEIHKIPAPSEDDKEESS